MPPAVGGRESVQFTHKCPACTLRSKKEKEENCRNNSREKRVESFRASAEYCATLLSIPKFTEPFEGRLLYLLFETMLSSPSGMETSSLELEEGGSSTLRQSYLYHVKRGRFKVRELEEWCVIFARRVRIIPKDHVTVTGTGVSRSCSMNFVREQFVLRTIAVSKVRSID